MFRQDPDRVKWTVWNVLVDEANLGHAVDVRAIVLRTRRPTQEVFAALFELIQTGEVMEVAPDLFVITS